MEEQISMDTYESRMDQKILQVREYLTYMKDMPQIEQAADAIATAFETDHLLASAGNGGSASNADQLIGEFVGRLNFNRGPYGAISFPGPAGFTAVGNDFGYDQVFARQAKALLKKGDVFVGYSTSGNSPNVIEAVRAAKSNGALTVGLCGTDGQLKNEVDIAIAFPMTDPQMMEEAHLFVTHIICELVEKRVTAGDPTAYRVH
jgi:D-sedoheptulose 7-phosphate isomerase